MKVTVLGCGPAGLLAAHAAIECGHDVTILSRKAPSAISGAQYIHRQIPGLCATIPDSTVRYVKLGTQEGYARKVYGYSDAPVSWGKYSGSYPMWYMDRLYERLWSAYQGHVVDQKVDFETLDQSAMWSDRVISTVPLTAVCPDPRSWGWKSQVVYISEIEQYTVGNQIVYNGQPSDPWYRMSCLNGRAWMEYSQPMPMAARVVKPIKAEWRLPRDLRSKVLLAGRYGRWDKEVLADSAYFETKEWLQ